MRGVLPCKDNNQAILLVFFFSSSPAQPNSSLTDYRYDIHRVTYRIIIIAHLSFTGSSEAISYWGLHG